MLLFNKKAQSSIACVSVVTGLIMAIIGVIPAHASTSLGLDFETGDFTGWDKGSQTGSLTGSAITGSGTGVNIISGPITFNAPARPAVGSPTKPDGSPNPYYAPAVTTSAWTFSPFGSKGATLQPNGSVQFNDAVAAVGLPTTSATAIRSLLSQQATASGFGGGTPTDASWLTATVTLSANTVYTMSWNYLGTDYVPFNDGSITSLISTDVSSSATVKVNNSVGNYALLGFTNPGTGDYSTNSYSSTGWQVSTYEVSADGTYRLGFMVFNLDDTALSPVLMIDSQPGGTTKNGQPFGAVVPNNPNAPVVTTTPATTAPATTTTTEPATTTTAPIVVSPPPAIYIPIPVVETTTEAPTTTIPPTTVVDTPTTSSVVPAPTTSALPVTGASAWLFAWGCLFMISGMFILIIRRPKTV